MSGLDEGWSRIYSQGWWGRGGGVIIILLTWCLHTDLRKVGNTANIFTEPILMFSKAVKI